MSKVRFSVLGFGRIGQRHAKIIHELESSELISIIDIEKDQLEKLQAVVTEINNITLEVGKLESNKHKMLQALNQSEQTLSVIQKELQDDYGNKIVDIKTGELKD